MMKILCPSKCCRPAAKKDDGEWMEPIKNKKNKRHFARKDPSIRENPLDDSTTSKNSSTRVSWEDWRKDLGGEDEEDDPKDKRHSAQKKGAFDSAKDSNVPRVERTKTWGDMLVALDEEDEIDGLENSTRLEDFEEVSKTPMLGAIGKRASDIEIDDDIPLDELKDIMGENFIATGTNSKEEMAVKRDAPSLKQFGRKASDLVIDDEIPLDELKDVMGEDFQTEIPNVHDEADSTSEKMTDKMSNRMTQMKNDMGNKLKRVTVAFGAPKSGLRGTLMNRRSEPQNFKVHLPKVAITSIASLGDGHFLTASRDEPVIKMWKVRGAHNIQSSESLNSEAIELVRSFEGHTSGITDLAKLDEKGRFLSAGNDLTVRLWDSRYNCSDDEDYPDEQPLTLLATFASPDKRRIHTIGVIEQGSYVRPTDSIDMAMVAAVAKKTALEGTQSVQEAAINREVIECSGIFATASKNGKSAIIWELDVAAKDKDPKNKSHAKITLSDSLAHDGYVEAMDTVEGKDMIVTGDSLGDVFLWQNQTTSLISRKKWTKVCKFTWRKEGNVYTPEEVFEQSVNAVCFLEGERKIVSSTTKGSIYIWRWDQNKNQGVVHKKEAIRVKAKKSRMAAIQCLPSIEDPSTNERCLAFSLGYEDGSVVSCVIRKDRESKKGKYGSFIFHVADYGHEIDERNRVGVEKNSVSSLALLGTSADGKPPTSVLIVGGSNEVIHLLSPTWSPRLGNEDALTAQNVSK